MKHSTETICKTYSIFLENGFPVLFIAEKLYPFKRKLGTMCKITELSVYAIARNNHISIKPKRFFWLLSKGIKIGLVNLGCPI